MLQFPHPQLKTKEDILNYYYAAMPKMAAQCSKLFPYPNELEFETMKLPFALYMKKNYGALEYNDKDWKQPPKLAIKGLPFMKRDRCLFVRKTGNFVIESLLYGNIDRILPFLKQQCTKLANGDICKKDLALTCAMLNDDEYKSDNLIQRITAQKIYMRTGRMVEPGSRLAYIVVEGNGPLYDRGESLQYAMSHPEIHIDLEYYLQKQLCKPIETLLMHHPRIQTSFSKIIQTAHRQIYRKCNKLKTISDFFVIK